MPLTAEQKTEIRRFVLTRAVPRPKAILETASRIIAQSPRDLPMIQEAPAVPPAAPKLGANARELPVLQ